MYYNAVSGVSAAPRLEVEHVPRPAWNPPNADDLVRRYQSGETEKDLAAEVGAPRVTFRNFLQRRGVHEMGRAKVVPSRRWAPHNPDDVIRRYLAGESEKALAEAYGVGRTAVRGLLERTGTAVRGRGDAMLTRMAQTSPEERAHLTAAANAAVLGSSRSEEDMIRRALAAEHGAYSNRVGRWENEIAAELTRRGYTSIPQKAIGRYNVDIAIEPVAVEVHSAPAYPHTLPRHVERIKYLADRGWPSVYVMATGVVRLGPVCDQLVTFLELAEGNPAALGQYRVVRSSGQLLALRGDELD